MKGLPFPASQIASPCLSAVPFPEVCFLTSYGAVVPKPVTFLEKRHKGNRSYDRKMAIPSEGRSPWRCIQHGDHPGP